MPFTVGVSELRYPVLQFGVMVETEPAVNSQARVVVCKVVSNCRAVLKDWAEVQWAAVSFVCESESFDQDLHERCWGRPGRFSSLGVVDVFSFCTFFFLSEQRDQVTVEKIGRLLGVAVDG